MLISEDATGRKQDKYFWTGGGSKRSCVASKCIISSLVFSKFLRKFCQCWLMKKVPPCTGKKQKMCCNMVAYNKIWYVKNSDTFRLFS